MSTVRSTPDQPGLTPAETMTALQQQIFAAQQKMQSNKRWAVALLAFGLFVLFLSIISDRGTDAVLVEIGTLGITDLLVARFLAVFSLIGSVLFYRDNRDVKNKLEIQQGELRDLQKTIAREEARGKA